MTQAGAHIRFLSGCVPRSCASLLASCRRPDALTTASSAAEPAPTVFPCSNASLTR